eukprot:TRINITY_DN4008_c1_g1_i1.p1 TRINITY_DN4008_c1_g1~~TRINITY_DN4008_c1_g1_i1.p1  ORF type:complete len:937 (-),score=391.72 TRINITY_DN4008_c1_g1_i1:77-2887(-)
MMLAYRKMNFQNLVETKSTEEENKKSKEEVYLDQLTKYADIKKEKEKKEQNPFVSIQQELPKQQDSLDLNLFQPPTPQSEQPTDKKPLSLLEHLQFLQEEDEKLQKSVDDKLGNKSSPINNFFSENEQNNFSPNNSENTLSLGDFSSNIPVSNPFVSSNSLPIPNFGENNNTNNNTNGLNEEKEKEKNTHLNLDTLSSPLSNLPLSPVPSSNPFAFPISQSEGEENNTNGNGNVDKNVNRNLLDSHFNSQPHSHPRLEPPSPLTSSLPSNFSLHSPTSSPNEPPFHIYNRNSQNNLDENNHQNSSLNNTPIKETKGVKDNKEIKEVEESKDDKDIKEVEENKEIKEIKEVKEVKSLSGNNSPLSSPITLHIPSFPQPKFTEITTQPSNVNKKELFSLHDNNNNNNNNNPSLLNNRSSNNNENFNNNNNNNNIFQNTNNIMNNNISNMNNNNIININNMNNNMNNRSSDSLPLSFTSLTPSPLFNTFNSSSDTNKNNTNVNKTGNPSFSTSNSSSSSSLSQSLHFSTVPAPSPNVGTPSFSSTPPSSSSSNTLSSNSFDTNNRSKRDEEERWQREFEKRKKEEELFKKQLESYEREKRQNFIKGNSNSKKQVEPSTPTFKETTKTNKEFSTPESPLNKFSTEFQHHITPFSQTIIKSSSQPLLSFTSPSDSVSPSFLSPTFPSSNNDNLSDKKGGEIEMQAFHPLSDHPISTLVQIEENIEIDSPQSVFNQHSNSYDDEIHNVFNQPQVHSQVGHSFGKSGKKVKSQIRIRRTFGMSIKEGPFKFVIDDYVHHNVFYLPIVFTALASMLFLILSKALNAKLFFAVIGIGLFVMIPVWLFFMRTRTTKVDARNGIIEIRTTSFGCRKHIQKYNLEIVTCAALRVQGNVHNPIHMIVFETRNKDIDIEVSLTMDSFNRSLKELTVSSFNNWIDNLRSTI